MKKIFLILVFSLLLSTLSSCKYNVSKNKYVTKEEAEEFVKDKINPFYEEKTSFVYKYKYEGSSFNKYEKHYQEVKYDIYGTLDNNLEGEFHYEVDKKTKSTGRLVTGREVQKAHLQETADIFKRKDSSDDKYYFIIENDYVIPDAKIKQQKLKTTLKGDSSFYSEVIEQLNSAVKVLKPSFINNTSDYDIIVPTGSYYYISKDKLKVVSSTSEYHTEEVFVFEDDVLVSYKYVKKNNGIDFEKIYEKELIIKNTKDVKVPKNAENYKTEYQKYDPGFFDAISLEVILFILALAIIVATAVLVTLRILKRPKYVE